MSNKYEENLKVYEEDIKRREEEIIQLKKCVEELKRKEIEGTVLIPEYRGKYWYVSTDECRVYRTFWRNFGDMYKTKEEAEFELERMNVLGELKKFSCKFRKGESNYYIFLNCNTNELGIVVSDCYISLDIYFESNAKAREAIKEIGEDRIKKYLFEVKE